MIAFSGAYAGEPDQIYVMDDHGKNLTCLTARHALPSYGKLWWLPDQQQLLVAAYAPYQRYYLLDRTSPHLRPFLPAFEPALIRQITPSGHIVFGAHGKDWVAPMHGTAQDCVAIQGPGDLVALSPDARRAVFTAGDPADSLFLQDRATGAVETIVLTDPEAEHYPDTYSAVWSPDGEYLAYLADDTELWIRHLHRGERRRVGDAAYFWLRYGWSPDSQYVSFIGATEPDGPDPTTARLDITAIATGATRSIARLARQEQRGGSWAWSASARQLVYATYEGTATQLYAINTETNHHERLTDPARPFAAISHIAVC